ncbi:MAG TPA: hypothetical protein PK191_06525 [Niabella sp.]|nr:hypothetical protein [Niabella sp.]HOZ97941.1 hypothetical protein [Niabella sp.]HQW15913.1 hypothetical protein [Niabella sp.]HQX21139.1 hypothetical protein [Niabella sp.]HQX40587.1 hypothetical protein [Niabella sp.]
MKKFVFVIINLLLLLSIRSFSQNVQVSGLFISYGTGDFFGYGIGTSFNKNVINRPRMGLSKLNLGGELFFENGTSEPKIVNTTEEDVLFREPFFYHVSGSTLWFNAAYYPLNKIIPGIHIALGPTLAYWRRSQERAAGVVINKNTSIPYRESILLFDNGVTIGYRISAGIDFKISKKIFTGARIDFSSNKKAEINSSLGLSLGYSLQ